MNLEKYRKQIKHLRYDYNNEIPVQIVNSVSGRQYKVRGGWFHCVNLWIGIGIEDGFVDDNFYRRFVVLRTFFKETRLGKRLTTKEDIDKIDYYLTDLLGFLERNPEHFIFN